MKRRPHRAPFFFAGLGLGQAAYPSTFASYGSMFRPKSKL